MDRTVIAWLILRMVYAWLYLWALKALLSDWKSTEGLVSLLCPFYTRFFAVIMVLVMFISAIMILAGIYAQIAGILLLIYNLLGAHIHYRLARMIRNERVSAQIDGTDKTVFNKVQALGVAGHVTSAQKNFILAAVALFIALSGSGPLSLTPLLW